MNHASAIIEDEARGDKSDDTTDADIPQEVLRQIDPRKGTQRSEHQQHQHRQIEQKPFIMVDWFCFLMIMVGQEQRAAGTEDEECGGVPRRERVAMMQINALYHGQYQIRVTLEHSRRALGIEYELQQLYHGTTRQFAQSEEDSHFYFLPKNREQRQKIQGPFCQRREILKKGVLSTSMMGIQQQMQL